MSRGWHILRAGSRTTLARRLPVRMDLAADTRLPLLRPVPLAHMIRQDLWRLLRDVRGFSPVVVVDKGPEDMLVSAGGRIEGGRATAELTSRVCALLSDPALRARWTRCAT